MLKDTRDKNEGRPRREEVKMPPRDHVLSRRWLRVNLSRVELESKSEDLTKTKKNKRCLENRSRRSYECHRRRIIIFRCFVVFGVRH